mgnify:CR=1 FL=1
MESKGTIEIIQTGATTAKVIVNGRDISGMVSSYTINHNANDVARLIATKLCELARHEYGIYDVVDYATIFEWLKEKHDEM